MKDQKFNIGDKLLCKIDCWTTKVYFFEGREYNICDIRTDYDYSDDYSYCIKDENSNKVLFMVEEDLDVLFYTKSEIRSIKIKKLKNEESKF